MLIYPKLPPVKLCAGAVALALCLSLPAAAAIKVTSHLQNIKMTKHTQATDGRYVQYQITAQHLFENTPDWDGSIFQALSEQQVANTRYFEHGAFSISNSIISFAKAYKYKGQWILHATTGTLNGVDFKADKLVLDIQKETVESERITLYSENKRSRKLLYKTPLVI